MRVLYFHQHFSTPKGAAGIRSYAMAQKLVERGHQVTMVCGSYRLAQTGLDGNFVNGTRRGTVNGIEVIEFDLSYGNDDGFLKRAWTFVRYALGSLRVARRENYDLVFATTTPLTAAIPAIAARWLRRKRYVFEVRDLWPELPRAMGVITNPIVLGALSVLEWLAYRNAERCIALSPGIAQGIARRGVAEDRIAMVPNGCDLSIFRNQADSWRPEGVRELDLMALFAGSHGMANGLDAALDAAAELKRRGRDDIKLVLIGDGKLKSELVERASREMLDNLVFHKPVPKERLAGLLQSADIGMQLLANVPAFYYGTSPNKFFDYVAAGLPVLNNYPGWLADMIQECGCGLAVEPDNAVAFADALEWAADNRGELREMGKRAAELAKKFDRAVLSEQWIDWVTGAARVDRQLPTKAAA